MTVKCSQHNNDKMCNNSHKAAMCPEENIY